jgi:hypothetical protein
VTLTRFLDELADAEIARDDRKAAVRTPEENLRYRRASQRVESRIRSFACIAMQLEEDARTGKRRKALLAIKSQYSPPSKKRQPTQPVPVPTTEAEEAAWNDAWQPPQE